MGSENYKLKTFYVSRILCMIDDFYLLYYSCYFIYLNLYLQNTGIVLRILFHSVLVSSKDFSQKLILVSSLNGSHLGQKWKVAISLNPWRRDIRHMWVTFSFFLHVRRKTLHIS